MTELQRLPPEVTYVGLLFGLFVVPKLLERYRIPSAITGLVLGAATSIGLGMFQHDATVSLFSALGITALFLFAGMEVDVAELRRAARVLIEHLLVRVLALALGTWVAWRWLGLGVRPAALLALALLTPSTGFILDALRTLDLSEQAKFWVRSKAVATELLALAVMFLTLQSADARQLGISAAVLVGMVLLLPFVFRVFAAVVVPHAPRSEFAFLIIVATVCALVTRRLGVYYLVGAFVVGMVARGFRQRLPAMSSEKMLHAVEAFASVFVPFYFFHAGLELRRDDLSLEALWWTAAFVGLVIPFRLALVSLHRRWRLRETWREGLGVSVSMLPTLVFTLVIARILREQFDLPGPVFGGLLGYALVNTVIPTFVMRTPPPEFEAPQLPPMGARG
ncbi:MAG: cation:proton antiporter [Anaeromyxobacteraceae bacterium]|nr:cation:proton antiporter [Anaeromyxobacteraceae bacterium]